MRQRQFPTYGSRLRLCHQQNASYYTKISRRRARLTTSRFLSPAQPIHTAAVHYGIIVRMGKDLYLVAGANGSGKSTIARTLLPQKGLVFVNPDEIAKDINPSNPPDARIAAGRTALARMDGLLRRGISFAVESTLSGKAHEPLVRRAKCAGFRVTIVYAFVDSVDACIARIAMRVQAGGHFVPNEDVRRRYLRSKRNFIEIYAPLADSWLLYYNGDSVPVLVAAGGCGRKTDVVTPRLYTLFSEGLCQTA